MPVFNGAKCVGYLWWSIFRCFLLDAWGLYRRSDFLIFSTPVKVNSLSRLAQGSPNGDPYAANASQSIALKSSALQVSHTYVEVMCRYVSFSFSFNVALYVHRYFRFHSTSSNV